MSNDYVAMTLGLD